MIPKPLQRYLEKLGVKAEAITHRTVYTAYDLAQTTGVELRRIAKAILVKVEPPYVGPVRSRAGRSRGSHYVIAVLPASHQLDVKKLKKFLKAKRVSIPHEHVMARLYKVKAGALTAFGPLHRSTPVVVDRALFASRQLIVRSGSFTESLAMKGRDFLAATAGVVASFAKRVSRR